MARPRKKKSVLPAQESDAGALEAAGDPSNALDGYPIDSLLIRDERRTIVDVLRRIERGAIKLDPDFQRDFLWDPIRQSRLVESVLMRIPLPVFYFAETKAGELIVVDGLQRLSTLKNFFDGNLKLELPKSPLLNDKTHSTLSSKLRDRFEDGQITFYLIDHKLPDRIRLDIFERVNSGVPLNRQQMRNAIYNGVATTFLKDMAAAKEFEEATGGALITDKNHKEMRDREAVNRFLAFHLLGWKQYGEQQGEGYDDFLGSALSKFNSLSERDRQAHSKAFRRSMSLNHRVFGPHAFRKHTGEDEPRRPLNLALFDVFSSLLPNFDDKSVAKNEGKLRTAFFQLMKDEKFMAAISWGTTSPDRVRSRFRIAEESLRGILG